MISDGYETVVRSESYRRHRSEIGKKGRVTFTPEMDVAIKELREKGAWFRHIADRVGVDRKTLMRRVDELGISRERTK